jgi:hypothetical protein
MKKRIRELENKRMDFEIKGKRERTAAFSYSLILLFSLCGAAGAAKMCAMSGSNGPTINSSVHSTTSGAWMLGINCGGNAGENSGEFAYSGGAPTAGVCDSVAFAGVEGYASKVDGCTIVNYCPNLAITLGRPADESKIRLCRITYPFQSDWVILGNTSATCAHYMRNYPSFFRAMLEHRQ